MGFVGMRVGFVGVICLNSPNKKSNLSRRVWIRGNSCGIRGSSRVDSWECVWDSWELACGFVGMRVRFVGICGSSRVDSWGCVWDSWELAWQNVRSRTVFERDRNVGVCCVSYVCLCVRVCVFACAVVYVRVCVALFRMCAYASRRLGVLA